MLVSALQQHESAIGIDVPPLPLHPTPLGCYSAWAELPESVMQQIPTGYLSDRWCMLQCYSPNGPTFFLTVSTSLFSMAASPLLPHK